VKEAARDTSPEERIVTRRKRHDSEDSTDSDASTADSEASSASSTVRRGEEAGEKTKNGQDIEGEDTMANLTSSFAGIFGKANLK